MATLCRAKYPRHGRRRPRQLCHLSPTVDRGPSERDRLVVKSARCRMVSLVTPSPRTLRAVTRLVEPKGLATSEGAAEDRIARPGSRRRAGAGLANRAVAREPSGLRTASDVKVCMRASWDSFTAWRSRDSNHCNASVMPAYCRTSTRAKTLLWIMARSLEHRLGGQARGIDVLVRGALAVVAAIQRTLEPTSRDLHQLAASTDGDIAERRRYRESGIRPTSTATQTDADDAAF